MDVPAPSGIRNPIHSLASRPNLSLLRVILRAVPQDTARCASRVRTAPVVTYMPTQPTIGENWRHTRTGDVIKILSPKLDTADQWYVRNGDFQRTLTTGEIIRDYVRD